MFRPGLEYARATVAVLRALQILNGTMRYGELARAIGLMSAKEPWGVWHRNQITEILNLVGATERQSGIDADFGKLEFERIVTAAGEPGVGVHKTSRIVCD
jgi:hypothetical protein